MIEMKNPGQGMVRMAFRIPARGLFGYRSEFLTDTRGTGMIHHRNLDYGPWAGPLSGRKRGVLVADREGSVVAFALGNLQERAQMFVAPGDLVYEGMIAGENSRPGDLDVNVTKEKKLSNMRTTASDENVILEPPRPITLEYGLEYIEEDELIEVDAEDDPAPEAGAVVNRPQEGRPRQPGGGRLLGSLDRTVSPLSEGIMLAWQTSTATVTMRRRFDEDADEFEDDGFSFDDDDDEDDEFLEGEEDLDDELDDEELDDEEVDLVEEDEEEPRSRRGRRGWNE
jgi:hypothetical protein